MTHVNTVHARLKVGIDRNKFCVGGKKTNKKRHSEHLNI